VAREGAHQGARRQAGRLARRVAATGRRIDVAGPKAPIPLCSDDLLHRFLAERGERTRAAYRLDIEEFATFVGQAPAAAVARLLAAGPVGGRQRMLRYAAHLLRRGRAHSTVLRRLSTLRALLNLALDLGLIDWRVEVPSHDEIRAVERQPPAERESYLFPEHPGEAYRLDVQHYAIRLMLGLNLLAPVEEPRRVLDVGCGTGRWCLEVGQQFTDALVVGLDLIAEPERHTSRYRLVRGDVLAGLPFCDGEFDLVHQRFLIAGVPLASWPAAVAELARVTRPGGWVELTEIPWVVRGRLGDRASAGHEQGDGCGSGTRHG
jgi:methyltransferase family protein